MSGCTSISLLLRSIKVERKKYFILVSGHPKIEYVNLALVRKGPGLPNHLYGFTY